MTGKNAITGTARDIAAGEGPAAVAFQVAVIIIAVLTLVACVVTGIRWLSEPTGGWYVHGEQFGVEIYLDGARGDRGQCSMALISGGYTVPLSAWDAPDGGNSYVGGNTPALGDFRLAREWLAGCRQGFRIAEGKATP